MAKSRNFMVMEGAESGSPKLPVVGCGDNAGYIRLPHFVSRSAQECTDH